MKAPEEKRLEEKEKLAAILRSLVQYEAEQAHRRIGWLGTLQGLLFTSLALGWDKNAKLSEWTAYLGIGFSLLVLAGLLAGVESGKRIRKRWRDFGTEGEDPTEVFGFYPDKHPLWVYAAPEVIMPVVFVIAWVRILFIISSSFAGTNQ